MQNTTHSTRASAQTRLTHTTSTPLNAQPKADPNWKPQPCGFSREELRAIVAEMLG